MNMYLNITPVTKYCSSPYREIKFAVKFISLLKTIMTKNL